MECFLAQRKDTKKNETSFNAEYLQPDIAVEWLFLYLKLTCGPPAFSENEAGFSGNEAGQKCCSAPGRACFQMFCSGVVKEGKGKGKEEVVANSAGENSCCSVPQSCLTLCNPMDCSRSGFPVLQYCLEFVQTHGQ